jgi:hypothetical protein
MSAVGRRSPHFFCWRCWKQKKSKDSGEKKKEEKLPRPSLLEVLENRELALSFRQFLHKWYSNEYGHPTSSIVFNKIIFSY